VEKGGGLGKKRRKTPLLTRGKERGGLRRGKLTIGKPLTLQKKRERELRSSSGAPMYRTRRGNDMLTLGEIEKWSPATNEEEEVSLNKRIATRKKE